MKTIAKKTLLLLLALVFCISMIGLVACKDEESDAPISFTEANVSIVQYFNRSLSVTYAGTHSIVWKSSDSSVATVSNGMVTAKKEGTAIISATAGSSTATCNITVTPFENEYLELKVEEPSVEMDKGQTKNISAAISYKSNNIVGELSYLSGDPEVATVSSNGKITAIKAGQTSILVKGSFNGVSISSIVNVFVQSDVTLTADVEKVNIYYQEDIALGYKSEYTPVFTCEDGGEVVANPQLDFEIIEFPGEEDVFEFTNGKIIAKNGGSALLSVTYVNAQGESANLLVAVNVNSIEEEISSTLDIDVSSKDEWCDYTVVSEITEEIISAKIQKAGEETAIGLRLEDGKVKIGNNHGDGTLILESRNVIYKLPVSIVYTLVLNNDNLANLKEIGDENVYIEEDIDFKEYFRQSSTEKWVSNSEFTGEFDGNGHVLYNFIGSETNGLFKSFGGEIKNVSFINATLKGAGALAYSVIGGADVLVEDVLVKISSVDIETDEEEQVEVYTGSLFKEIKKGDTEGSVKFENMVVYMPNLSDEYGFIAGECDQAITLENVHLVNNTLDGEVAMGVIGSGSTSFVQNGTEAKYPNVYELKNVIETKNLSEAVVDNYYIACPVVELYANDESIEKLQNLTDEYVVIKEDLNIDNNYEWTTNSEFSGILDGQGHDLGTLFIHDYRVGLFKSLSGVVKNLSLTARFRAGASGVITNSVKGTALVENVFIDVINVDGGDAKSPQGIIAYSVAKDANLTVKDVIVVSEEVAEYELRGVVAQSNNGTITLSNAYFIGFGENYVASGNPVTGQANAYDMYETVNDMIKAINTEEISSGEYAIAALMETYPVLYITQDNIRLLETATKGNVYLTEDIDMSGISDWKHEGIFTGVFDGCGYKIKNFKGSYEMGLFGQVENAIIKNVAFIDADMSGERPAVIAGVVQRGLLTVENVYISTTGSQTAYAGAVAYTVHPVTFRNVMIECNVTCNNANSGTFIGRASNTQTFENCYLIKGESNVFGTNHLFGNNQPSGAPTIVGTIDVDYFIFNTKAELNASTNANVDLTEMMNKYVGTNN